MCRALDNLHGRFPSRCSCSCCRRRPMCSSIGCARDRRRTIASCSYDVDRRRGNGAARAAAFARGTVGRADRRARSSDSRILFNQDLSNMRVYTPGEVAKHAGNKYLGVLVAAKFARVLNEFPRDRSSSREKKLTTRSLEELSTGEIQYRVVPKRRAEG